MYAWACAFLYPEETINFIVIIKKLRLRLFPLLFPNRFQNGSFPGVDLAHLQAGNSFGTPWAFPKTKFIYWASQKCTSVLTGLSLKNWKFQIMLR